jgi:flagellar biosynthetic protein FliP
MDPETTTSAGNVAHSGSRSKRAFVLHFLEMIIVMLVGMGVFSALAALAFGAAGSSLSDQSGAFRVMAMGFNMTVPMVLWMSIRGHSAPRNLEMAAAMLLPTFIAAALVWAGALGVMSGMGIQHAVMVPAMLAVMLWRYDEYARPHRRHHG